MLIDVDEAVHLLQKGEVVSVPTETVYGLAAIATNPEAIAKIFEIKKRPADNPLICHFHSIEQIQQYVTGIPGNTLKLLHHFSPGPVSFMLDLPEDSPLKFATCGSPQVIARIPDHALFLSIIKKTMLPVAAPSANTSGKVSPTTVGMVLHDIGEKIAGIVDGGAASVGLESSILDARSNGDVFILRPGAIGEKEIKSILADVNVVMVQDGHNQRIPGTKYAHYAPATPVYEIQNTAEITEHPNAAVFLTLEAMQTIPRSTLHSYSLKGIHLVNIGSTGDLNSMAKNFYHVIASVDQLNVSCAFFLLPDFGISSLGKALQNRCYKIIVA
ncbi:MAG: L-threonylcarbamoyladenylate synthase [Chitinophagales bacterium]